MHIVTHLPTNRSYIMRYRPEYPTLFLPQILVNGKWVAKENFSRWYKVTAKVNIEIK